MNRTQFDICHNICLSHVFAKPERPSLQPQGRKIGLKHNSVYYALIFILQNNGIPMRSFTNDDRSKIDNQKWAFKYNASIVAQDTERGAGEDREKSKHEQNRHPVAVVEGKPEELSALLDQHNSADEEGYEWTSEDISWKIFETEDDVLYFDTEIITRDLPCNLVGFQELWQGIELIRANVSLLVNETCGFTVHLGNEGQCFSLNTLKRFSHLGTELDNSIESILHMDFLLGINCRTRALSPSEGYHLNNWNVFRNLQLIERCTNLESFIEVMNPGHDENFAYNFLNLVPDTTRYPSDEKRPRTVELRQCRGTTDVLEISSYIFFIGGLFSFAHEMPPQLILPLCMQYATDSDFTILGLLESIGRGLLIQYYESVLTIGPRPSTLTLVWGSEIGETFLHHHYGYHPTPESWKKKCNAREIFLRQVEQTRKSEVVSKKEFDEWEREYEKREFANIIFDHAKTGRLL